MGTKYKYNQKLNEEEKTKLNQITSKGKASARTIKRAQILLLVDEGKTYQAIAQALHVSKTTAFRTMKKFAKKGLDSSIKEDPRPGKVRKLDGKQEAFLIATACSEPPDGRKVWTMKLLADKMVVLEVVDSISDETVRRTLKKGGSNPGYTKNGVSRR